MIQIVTIKCDYSNNDFKPSKINSHEYLHMNLSVYLSDK